MIDKIEKRLNSHILFLYNNPKLDDAMIDEEYAFKIQETLEELKDYSSVLVVINTRGGNLKSGTIIARSLKEYFQKVSYYVPERCGSTGTFMLLAADTLYRNKKAIITPCEPQMDTIEGESISTSIIRNYLENDPINRLDPIDMGRYYATIKYFKDLSQSIYKDNKDKIIEFMLTKVNSHEYPLTEKDLESMDIKIEDLDEFTKKEIETIFKEIKKDTEKNPYENVHNIILSRKGTSLYKRIFDTEKKKKEEGYYDIKYSEKEKIYKKKIGE